VAAEPIINPTALAFTFRIMSRLASQGGAQRTAGASNSEATIQKYYLRYLRPEEGQAGFMRLIKK
jgi:hypothetical protein